MSKNQYQVKVNKKEMKEIMSELTGNVKLDESGKSDTKTIIPDNLTEQIKAHTQDAVIDFEFEDGTKTSITMGQMLQLAAKDYVNPVSLIRVKKYDGNFDNDSSCVTLRYYDLKENKWKSPDYMKANGEDILIPLFYQDLYDGIWASKNMVFYAKKEHLTQILQMLAGDMVEIEKRKKANEVAIEDFAKGLKAVKTVEVKQTDIKSN